MSNVFKELHEDVTTRFLEPRSDVEILTEALEQIWREAPQEFADIAEKALNETAPFSDGEVWKEHMRRL